MTNSLYKTEAKGAERKIQDQSTGIVHALQGVGKPVGLTLDGMVQASIK